MKRTGASLAVYALEQIGVKYTFGIPGVHNIELYDELNNSKDIEPILVTHEGGASFMAFGVSCTSDSIGTLMIVPAAGTTHAMSGIGEAFLDGIPMLIITGGTRQDSGRHYQLHQLDQENLVDEITKAFFKVKSHKEIIPTLYKAYEIAISGEPGPVFIEIPIELQMFKGEVDKIEPYVQNFRNPAIDELKLSKAAKILAQAKNPGIYVGWGAAGATAFTARIAELLGAPVATTLQGKASFPASNPLHTGFGFGPNSVPASQKAFADCDAMLAVGVRFSEIGTGSFGVKVPENLVHIDIKPTVFDKNYPTKVAIEGDASDALSLLAQELERILEKGPKDSADLKKLIATEKQDYFGEWKGKPLTDKVSPGYFFEALTAFTDDDTYFVVDDGKHTYLAAELLPINRSRHFVSPTDFNCMGFCVPAAIGVKFMNPDHKVVGIVGDGGFLMTGMEALTASTYKKGVVYFIFHDGELGQISQFQKIPLNRKVATIIGNVNFKGMADATGAAYLHMANDSEIKDIMQKAFLAAESNVPVIVDVNIDYSKKTYMTKGVVKVNLGRFTMKEKVRFIGRAIKRHLLK
ncbi:thiamine pyrophosphate-binding protein [Flavobacteriaceae bacterium F89]|uniref:Thiamine pyrophosphate-binding protein n=1 Tax=Cerina litoralis TaxID=2874477 RepID=A0AAE3JMM0_9FLAO|nr:thiamine pyrophosphate-binding protein [Cerina litoralis]MCG2460020.1 thiamine pyrophosphate-binding protein [Cerina litoralis]